MAKDNKSPAGYGSRVFRPMHEDENGVLYFYTGFPNWTVNGPFILSCLLLTAMLALYPRLTGMPRALLVGATIAAILLFAVMFFLAQKANPVYLEGNVLRMKGVSIPLDEETAVSVEKDLLVFTRGTDTIRFNGRSRGTWDLIRRCRDIYRVQFARGVMNWFEMEKRGQSGQI